MCKKIRDKQIIFYIFIIFVNSNGNQLSIFKKLYFYIFKNYKIKFLLVKNKKFYIKI